MRVVFLEDVPGVALGGDVKEVKNGFARNYLLPKNLAVPATHNALQRIEPARIADDGDRDGLPNVLLEAQSQGLACVATRVSAIPELIEDGVTGVLLAERDPAALAAAIDGLAGDPERRRRLGEAGRRRVRRDFDFETCLAPLAAKFGLSVDRDRRRALG